MAERLTEYDIVLVVIGPAWHRVLEAKTASGEDDFVRWEVAEALRCRKRVIPVLVDCSALPAESTLLADIAALGRLQAETLQRGTLAMGIGSRVYGSFALYAEMARLIFPMSHREHLRNASRQIGAENLLAEPPSPGTWRGKIIVGGVRHPLDILQTRLDSAGPQGYGFEFQADTANSLLTGAVVTPVGFLAQWMMSLFMALAAIAYRLWRVGKSRRLDLAVLPLTVLVYLSSIVLLYAKFRLLVDGLYHLAAFIVTWWVLAKLEKRWSHATK